MPGLPGVSEMKIYIGTSGYSYDDWREHYYPSGLNKNKMLEFYAREFSFVEVNSSYYSLARPEVFARLAQKTPPEFVFAVKGYKSFTHERGADVAEDVKKFCYALAPLLEKGKLGTVLLQFPYSFPSRPENRRYLASLRDLLGDVPAVAEFRHRSWVREDTWELLKKLGLGYVCVDEPDLPGLVGRAVACTGPVAYVRFHGRNKEKWWRHEHAYERYDYLYTESELQEWVPGIQSLVQQAERVYVAFNNHYRGQAVHNARMLKQILGL